MEGRQKFLLPLSLLCYFEAPRLVGKQLPPTSPLLLYNRHAGLKQFVINFRVGKKVEIKTQNFFFTLAVVAVSLAPD